MVASRPHTILDLLHTFLSEPTQEAVIYSMLTPVSRDLIPSIGIGR
jgi:hypothetical protein